MKESTNPFEFCFDEETNQLCTKNLKTGKIEKLSEKHKAFLTVDKADIERCHKLTKKLLDKKIKL